MVVVHVVAGWRWNTFEHIRIAGIAIIFQNKIPGYRSGTDWNSEIHLSALNEEQKKNQFYLGGSLGAFLGKEGNLYAD